MKRFVITLFPANGAKPRDMLFRNPITGRDFIAYGHQFPAGTMTKPVDDPCPVYWADDEESAKGMAQLLTYQRPGATVLISETRYVYQTVVPANLDTTISKLSSKGLLPE